MTLATKSRQGRSTQPSVRIKRRRWLAAMLPVFFVLLALLSAQPSQASYEYFEGIQRAKLDPASETAEKNSLVALNNEGVRALHQDDYREAISKFETTLRINPRYKLGRLNLGIALNNFAIAHGRPKDAVIYLERAAYVDPSNSTTASNLSRVILSLGFDPDSVEERERLGDQRMDDGEFECAIAEYSAAMTCTKGAGHGEQETLDRIGQKIRDADLCSRGQEPRWKRAPLHVRLLNQDYDAISTVAMFALYLLDLSIVVECMRRVSSQKRSWWIFGLIIGIISVSAGFLLGQANAFRHVLGLLVLGLPPARALYAVTKKKGGHWLYMGAVFLAAIPCTIFFLFWLQIVAINSVCSMH